MVQTANAVSLLPVSLSAVRGLMKLEKVMQLEGRRRSLFYPAQSCQ